MGMEFFLFFILHGVYQLYLRGKKDREKNRTSAVDAMISSAYQNTHHISKNLVGNVVK